MDKMAEKVDDHLQPVPQDIMGSVTRTDPETLRQYEETGRITVKKLSTSVSVSDSAFVRLRR